MATSQRVSAPGLDQVFPFGSGQCNGLMVQGFSVKIDGPRSLYCCANDWEEDDKIHGSDFRGVEVVYLKMLYFVFGLVYIYWVVFKKIYGKIIFEFKKIG